MLILKLLLLILLPHSVFMFFIVKCRIRNPHPPVQEYRQSGDFLVGGIPSQSFDLSSTEFNRYPQAAAFEELM